MNPWITNFLRLMILIHKSRVGARKARQLDCPRFISAHSVGTLAHSNWLSKSWSFRIGRSLRCTRPSSNSLLKEVQHGCVHVHQTQIVSFAWAEVLVVHLGRLLLGSFATCASWWKRGSGSQLAKQLSHQVALKRLLLEHGEVLASLIHSQVALRLECRAEQIALVALCCWCLDRSLGFTASAEEQKVVLCVVLELQCSVAGLLWRGHAWQLRSRVCADRSLSANNIGGRRGGTVVEETLPLKQVTQGIASLLLSPSLLALQVPLLLPPFWRAEAGSWCFERRSNAGRRFRDRNRCCSRNWCRGVVLRRSAGGAKVEPKERVSVHCPQVVAFRARSRWCDVGWRGVVARSRSVQGKVADVAGRAPEQVFLLQPEATRAAGREPGRQVVAVAR